MSKKSLNDHMVTYYKEKKLPPDLRNNLLSTIQKSHQKEVAERRTPVAGWASLSKLLFSGRFAYASIVVLLGYVAWMVSDLPETRIFQNDLKVAISHEIEMNHRKKFNVEFKETSIAGLIKQMDKLDFSLVLPARFAQSMTITGARYCSIRGKIAAQIQMIDTDGKYCTLYQTRLVAPLSKINNALVMLDGVNYSLWHEEGVFLGFAGPLE